MKKSELYFEVFNAFKRLCAEGKQTCSFASFCQENNVTKERMHYFMKDHGLRVMGLPGYTRNIGRPRLEGASSGKAMEIPFANVIFEEAGFLPAAEPRVITVSVGGHVAVSFPADTDVAAIAKFIREMGKEAGHVES